MKSIQTMNQKILKYVLYLLLTLTLAAAAGLLGVKTSQAADRIIRPFHSVRSLGMGGVFLTTGLYDENFFGNPARVTANPKWKVQIFDLAVEANASTISSLSSLLSG